MVYIFHGDDTHSQQATLAGLLAKLGDPSMLELNTTRLEGVPPLSQLRHACDSIPFLAQVRVVIVNDLFSSHPDKVYMDELLDYLPRVPDSTRLFFLESAKLPGNHRVLNLARKDQSAYVRQFNRPEGRELEKWIRQRVAREETQIAPQAIYLLAQNVGNDLFVLDNEIEKLIMYKGGHGQIEAEDVNLLSPYAAEASIFDLVDALGNRDPRMASLLLHKKLSEGADPFYLFSMFVRQFRLLIQVKELAESGNGPPTISRQLRLHNFVAGKLYQQSQRFTLPQLEQIHRHLLEVDVGVKTGRDELVTALHLLVAGLTASN